MLCPLMVWFDSNTTDVIGPGLLVDDVLYKDFVVFVSVPDGSDNGDVDDDDDGNVIDVLLCDADNVTICCPDDMILAGKWSCSRSCFRFC